MALLGDIEYRHLRYVVCQDAETALDFAINEGLLVDVAALPVPALSCAVGSPGCQGQPFPTIIRNHGKPRSYAHCPSCRHRRSLKYPVINGVISPKGLVTGTDLSVLGRFEGTTSQGLELIYHWTRLALPKDIAPLVSGLEKNLSSDCVELFFAHMNKLAWETLMTAEPMGMDHDNTVQIDEALFKGKRKNNTGRYLGQDLMPDVNGANYGPAVEGPWVFGLVCRDRLDKLDLRMFVVERRNAATLGPIVTRHVYPGQMVHSDEWRAYFHLANWALPNYIHQTVNHTENFVDPVTGAHTQRIESCWGHVKTHIMRNQHGVQSCLQESLAHYWFVKKHAGNLMAEALRMIRTRRQMVN